MNNKKAHDLKSTLNFIFVIVLLVILSILTYFWSESVDKAKTEIEQNWLPSTRVLGAIKTITTAYRLSEMEHVLSLQEDDMHYYENSLDSLHKKLGEYNDKAVGLISSKDENELYQKFRRDWDKYYTVSQKSITLSKKNLNQEALNLLRKESHPLYIAMVKTLDNLIELNVMSATKTSEYSENQSSKYKGTLFVILLLGGFALMIFLYDLYKKLF